MATVIAVAGYLRDAHGVVVIAGALVLLGFIALTLPSYIKSGGPYKTADGFFRLMQFFVFVAIYLHAIGANASYADFVGYFLGGLSLLAAFFAWLNVQFSWSGKQKG